MINSKKKLQSQSKNNHLLSTSRTSNAASDAKSCSEDDGCLCKTKETAKAKTDNQNLLVPPVLALFDTLKHNSNGYRPNSHHLTQQATAPPADPLSSDAERKSKPSSESTEQKMEKLEQAPQQPTAASAHPPSSDAERESKLSTAPRATKAYSVPCVTASTFSTTSRTLAANATTLPKASRFGLRF